VWYPAAADAEERPIDFPGQSEIFVRGSAAQNAPLEPKKFPSNCGLPVRFIGAKFYRQPSWAPLSVDNAAKVIGVVVGSYSAEFIVFPDLFNVNFEEVRKDAIYRPWDLIFNVGWRRRKTFPGWYSKGDQHVPAGHRSLPT
jgi:hypothetical protein